jgi:hypothetical protein
MEVDGRATASGQNVAQARRCPNRNTPPMVRRPARAALAAPAIDLELGREAGLEAFGEDESTPLNPDGESLRTSPPGVAPPQTVSATEPPRGASRQCQESLPGCPL